MNETKFYLQSFFNNHRLKLMKSLIDNIWTKIPEKIQEDKQEINENIKKIGNSDVINILTNKNIKDIYDEYQKYWKEYKTFKNILSKQLKEGFLILFPNLNEGVQKGLYDDPDQFDDFLNRIIAENKQYYLQRLISELLYHYPNNNPLLFSQLKKIYNALDKSKKSNQLLIEAHNLFHLIEAKGPAIIAQDILNTNKDLDSTLKDIWIKERHLSNGIGKFIALYICLFAQKSIHLENEDTLSRFLEYFTPKGLESHRYNDVKLIVETLLNPFKNGKPKNNSFKTKITRFLDQHVGDPRHKSERWINMPQQKAIFLRWKIDETIKDFLELLSYTAQENPDVDRMWPYRKEFIECYWEEGHISDAWIILGKKDYANRHQFLKEDYDEYGQLQGGNSAHSVLLFRIGDLVISEWNYNGKARIWKEGNKYATQFYKKAYLREDVIEYADEEFIHRYPERYSWQDKMSDYIYEYTDILCPEKLQKKFW